MADKKPEELNEAELGNVTGGDKLGNFEIQDFDAQRRLKKPGSKKMDVVNEDEFASTASGDPNV